MYLVESKGGAILCMLLALFFLGTWPAVLTLLERRGRLPQHSYLDYSITNLLAALIIAFTFGEIVKSTTSEPNFLAQLAQIEGNILPPLIVSYSPQALLMIWIHTQFSLAKSQDGRIIGLLFCLQWLVVWS